MAADGKPSAANKKRKRSPLPDPQPSFDPQYLYILPTFFEVTEEIKRLAAIPGDGPGQRNLYARALLGFADPDYRKNVNFPLYDFPKDDSWSWRVSCQVVRQCFNALSFIGLNFHGGLGRFFCVLSTALEQNRPMMNLDIMVYWPSRAQKYVKLGTKVNSFTKMLQEPSSVNAALADYELIKSLVSSQYRYSTPFPTTVSYSTKEEVDEDQPWIDTRIMFREKVLELHENQVVDLIIDDQAGYPSSYSSY
ncbi:hypothetical protein DM02DRAFT_654423 [Periconia macrospinosa]|uniref:Uncharacterized protein n=1 Tax=Periconia macrospinosa TaxID=97972 RepID=A0A2V1DW61_9PLEO|nr:hypothetical protein DM02DRAFT_654423 [Periconia macrospinosa]